MDTEKKVNFTQKLIESVEPAEHGTRSTLQDSQIKGLLLRVTDKGIKSFVLRRTIKGRQRRLFVGNFPDLSVEKARKKANGFLGQIADGEDPADKRQADRKQMTLQQAWDKYYEDRSKAKSRGQEDKQKFEKYLASNVDGLNLAVRKLTDIRHDDVETLHAKIGAKHPTMANRVRALLSHIFNEAKIENPCKYVKKFREESRKRFLQPDELPKFFRAVKDEPLKDFFFLLLLTGARCENVRSMAWNNITIIKGGRAEWAIPRTKSGDSQIVPLTSEAVAILKERKKSAAKEDLYVFKGEGKHGYIDQPKRAWGRILKKAKLKDLRMHDLRRSLASAMIANDVNITVVQKTLGHADIATTMVYARLNIDPVRAAMQSTTSSLWIAGGLKPKRKTARKQKKPR